MGEDYDPEDLSGYMPEIPDSGAGDKVRPYKQPRLPLRPRWEHPAQRSFWHSLDVTEREAVTAASKEQVFWPGTTLCRQGDVATDVLVIRFGWTKVTVLIDQREKIIAFRGQGDTVGERAALTAASRSATVVALDDVRALVIPADRFRDLVMEHPHILEVLKRQEWERQAEHADGVVGDERVGTERRLAGLLLELAVRRGGYEPDGAVTITLPISAHELANWVDARPEAVAWCLNSWRSRGVIHASEHQITVVDAAGLEKICGVAAIRALSPVRLGISSLFDPRAPLNCSVFYTDVAAFGDPRRDDDDRRVVKEALYRILREAFEGSNVPWSSCLHEDRGDGVLTIAPPNVSTVSLVDPLLALLAAKLKRHNRQAGEPVRIQLRCALHVGPVLRDARGLSGHALIYAARMLDAPILKESLAATGADLAFMASTHVYDTVIRHAPGLSDPAAYQQVQFQVKEAKITSWMYLAGVTP